MAETMELKPNFPVMYRRFFEEALAMLREHGAVRIEDAEGVAEAQAVRKVLAVLNVAIQSISTVENFQAFREEFGAAISEFAGKMDAIDTETWEREG